MYMYMYMLNLHVHVPVLVLKARHLCGSAFCLIGIGMHGKVLRWFSLGFMEDTCTYRLLEFDLYVVNINYHFVRQRTIHKVADGYTQCVH